MPEISRFLIQVLVFTHEMADDRSWFSELAENVYPVIPLCMYGRSASVGKHLANKECVYYCSRDLQANILQPSGMSDRIVLPCQADTGCDKAHNFLFDKSKGRITPWATRWVSGMRILGEAWSPAS